MPPIGGRHASVVRLLPVPYWDLQHDRVWCHRTFLGLNHEAIFYDPEALVEPVRIVRNFQKLSGFDEGDPYVFIECVQTIFPVNGTPTPVSPGTVIEYEVPDMYGRPWAHIWEKYWEQGMKRPESEDIFDFEN